MRLYLVGISPKAQFPTENDLEYYSDGIKSKSVRNNIIWQSNET
jgi:hypothetical protein